jgi:predicted anti-sigma-YlaC factor YlaD
MTCNEIHELMPDLAAGLSTASPEIEKHVAGCAACAGKLAEMRKTMALLDEWQAPEPSPYFDVRMQARLREEMAHTRLGWLQWMRKPALAVALTLLVVVGGTVVTRRDVGIRGPGANPETPFAQVEPGTAVGDLQALDKNHELYADFDLLDDLQVQDEVTANP